jgi:ATPase family associated with various cellular activities (AAA)/Winged helix domain, variant
LSAGEAIDWQSANQRYLVAALGRVREALRRHAGDEAGGDDTELQLSDAAAALPAPAALDAVCASFGLSSFERDVLLLCAGVELDGDFAELCAVAQGDPRRTYPTFGLALAALPAAHWSALSPEGPLRRWRLVESAPGEGLTTGRLEIDERVLHHLAGISTVDERMRGLVRGVPARPQPASRAAAADRVLALWKATGEGEPPPAVQLCGCDAAGRRAVAAVACAKSGLAAVALDAAELPATSAEQEVLARLWEREAALTGAALVLEVDQLDDAARQRGAVAFLEAVGGWRLVSSSEPVRSRLEPILRVDVSPLSAAEQRELWTAELDGTANADELAAVAQQFRLGGDAVTAAAARVRAGGSAWDACREQARPRLDDLAGRIEPAAHWDDLVLPEPQLGTLREIALHVRHRATVYEDWGFAAKGARGLGISALFAGPSGTGKTMAAEVLANELRLDLYRIDLSSVVSKYIGETEKNLRRVFDAAEEGGAILLFDEADALFGKRSEVKDSHDRYANIEVSYLLQRMEAYRGLAILTTNQKSALDQAFLRRIRFVVEFPFPDPAQRAEIWRRIFPADTPTERLDHARLARLNVAGGNIRNIALGAAFVAADAGEAVCMEHLLRAARREYAKLEKPLSEAEIGGWT